MQVLTFRSKAHICLLHLFVALMKISCYPCEVRMFS